MGRISVFINYTNPPKINKRILSNLSKSVILNEDFLVDQVNIVLADSVTIRGINKQFLSHDYDTDVISFRLNEGEKINGEIYISIDQTLEQAKTYRVTFQNELARLVAHGTLHLCGYDDHTDSQKKQMTSKENLYLKPIKDQL